MVVRNRAPATRLPVEQTSTLHIQRTTGPASDTPETKFAHLLQPIRALADNWDIDLAKELEEYVGDLEKLSYTFDDGATKMNFAQAALLIQGSASVYSKKVEYLYSMVHQTLEAVMEKRGKQKSSVDDAGFDADISMIMEDEFLTCDDIEESTNIDLVEELGEKKGASRVPLLPRIPPSLIPANTDSDDNKTCFNGELVTATGEVIGRRDDFKINTAIVHSSGALLLESCESIMAPAPRFVTNAANSPNDDIGSNMPHEIEADVQPLDFPPDEHPVADDILLPQHRTSDDLVDDLCDERLSIGGDNDDFNEPDSVVGDENEMQEAPVHEELIPAQPEVVQHRPPPEPQVDPWSMLDPHAPNTMTDKPYKKGRPYRIPNLKKKNDVDASAADLIPVKSFLNRMQSLQLNRRPLPKNPMKGPYFEEFDYIFFAEQKRRRDIVKQLLKEEEVESAVRQDAGLAMEVEASPWDLNVVGNDDGQFLGAEEYNEPAVDGDDGFDDYAHEDNFVENDVAPIGFEDPVHEIPETYEDLCKMRIESYLLSAERFEHEVESTLAKKVRSWETRLKPILEEHERRPFLDVCVYGNKVVDKFATNNITEQGVLPFSTVVCDAVRHEIPRLFLATLHLANARNVDIHVAPNGDMTVTLLDRNVRSLDT